MGRIVYGIHGSEFGEVVIARSARGLCWLGFMCGGYKGGALERMKALFAGEDLSRDDAGTAALMKDVMGAWRAGALRDIDLDLRGTDFQRAVWDALLDIPAGETRSYGDIARVIGRERAVRAVGTAVGQNPVSIAVPCHRVVRNDGGLGNYAWGVDVKRSLLVAEEGELTAAA